MFFGDGLETPLMATEYTFQVPSPGGGMVMGSVTVTTQCIPITETVYGQVNGGEARGGGRGHGRVFGGFF